MEYKKKLYQAERLKDIREIVKNAVEKFPDHNAFMLKEKVGKENIYHPITFSEFWNEINGLGTEFMNMGLQGKRIAIISPNRYEWCSSYLAVVCGVGIVVPLDKGLPEEEIASLLKRSKADAVIFDQKYLENMNEIRQMGENNLSYYICMDEVKQQDILSYKKIVSNGKNRLDSGDTRYLQAKIEEEKMSILLYTSGTTSASKAVMLSHKNIAENIYALNCIVKVYDTDVSLAFLPLHHTFGATGFLFFLANGATAAFCDGLRYIQQNLKEYKVSIFVCVPLLLEAMYKKINYAIEKQGKTKLIQRVKKLSNLLLKIGIDIRRKVFKVVLDQLGGNIRLVVSGAAAIDKEVAKGFNELGVLTIQGYGLTETSPVLCAENIECIKYGSVGLPLVNVEIEIDQPNEKGIGEIKAKGPNVMLGYYENEQATEEVLKDGWFYTGDLGYIDQDGVLFITGRKKNVIVLKNGKNIYPEELETKVGQLPYVQENMIFGYPKEDDLVLAAKVVYNEEYVKERYSDISEQELEETIWKDIKEINKGMPNYKHIKKLIVTKEPMIKTTTQKVKRFAEIEKIIQGENK